MTDLTYDEIKDLLYAHHEARALGRALGISDIEAWGMVCPVCRNASGRQAIVTGPLAAARIPLEGSGQEEEA